jgi:hypothetical protein
MLDIISCKMIVHVGTSLVTISDEAKTTPVLVFGYDSLKEQSFASDAAN